MGDLASSKVELSDFDEVQEHFQSRGWTDGLPIVPPTGDRVRRMVEYTGRDPQDLIASLPPAAGEATVEKVAVNAVMAGCKPEYMPVIIAALEALMEPEFNLNGIQTTTNPTGPLLIVNGPIRQRLEINCGANALGPGWRANATIGRAIRLILVNVGGATPGPVDKATQGMPGKYTMCFGENEEENPWEPLHVERGFQPQESAVTVVAAQGTTNILEDSPDPQEVLLTIGASLIEVGCNNFHTGEGEPLVVLNPMHVALIAGTGFSKSDFKRYLHEKARAPREWLSTHAIERRIAAGAPVQDWTPMVRRWEDYMVVVAGGAGGLHTTFMPTFGNTYAVTKAIQEP